MKNLVFFALKAAISAGLLYLASRSVNFTLLRDRLAIMNPAWATGALALFAAQVVLIGMRWKIIAALCGASLSFGTASLFNLIGMFFNQTLPSTVGGDAARIVMVARAGSTWRSATYSVLVDRAVGLVWLALIVLACLPWSIDLIQNPVGHVTLVLIGFGGLFGPSFLYAATRALRRVLNRWRATRHLAELAEALWDALTRLRSGPALGVLSISIHLATVLSAWMIAQAIGSQLDLLKALLLIPPVILISAVPISIAGWGVREGAMIAAFSYAGLPESDGLAISVLLGLGLSVIGAAGGLAWIASGRNLSSDRAADTAQPDPQSR